MAEEEFGGSIKGMGTFISFYHFFFFWWMDGFVGIDGWCSGWG